MRNPGIDQLLQHPAIWRAGQLSGGDRPCIPSGFPALDAELPGSGWPVGTLSELLVDDDGIGEISLLLPALQQVSETRKGIALISPPYLPFARAWEASRIQLDRLLIVEGQGNDLLWSAEQALKSGSCGMVVIWGQRVQLDYGKLRRLQLAAQTGNAACVLYRPIRIQGIPSAAPLRMTLAAANDGLLIAHIIKRRGGLASQPIRVPIHPAHWRSGQGDVRSTSPHHDPTELFPVQPSPVPQHLPFVPQ